MSSKHTYTIKLKYTAE